MAKETIRTKSKEKVEKALYDARDRIRVCNDNVEILDMAYETGEDATRVFPKGTSSDYKKNIREVKSLRNGFRTLQTRLEEFRHEVGGPDISGYSKTKLNKIKKIATQVADQMESLKMKKDAKTYRTVTEVADMFMGKPVSKKKRKAS